MNKKWYQSKTVWFNAITILMASVSYFGWTPNQVLSDQISVALVGVAPVVNLILRFITKSPLG